MQKLSQRIMRNLVVLKSYPSHLGIPVTNECGGVSPACNRSCMFTKCGILSYYGVKYPEIDHYELYVVLKDGRRIELEENNQLTPKQDLLQIEIEKTFPDVERNDYRKWISSLIPASRDKPSDDHFLIVLRYFSGITPCAFQNILGDVYWCPRWPTETEIKSMLLSVKDFEFGIAPIVHGHA